MQLVLVLALLLLGAKNQNFSQTLGEIKPVLEELGGEELKSALSSVEQIGGLINAVGGLNNLQNLFGGATNSQKSEGKKSEENCAKDKDDGAQGFPLKPVSKIADQSITYALSQYFSETV